MAILFPLFMRPHNAAVTWSTTCSFWQTTTSVCPTRMAISGFQTITQVAVSGGWWSGTIGPNCAGSDAYVASVGSPHNTIYINIWKALADSLWSSSVVISVYGRNASLGGGTVSRQADVRPESASSPAAQQGPSVNINGTAGCPGTLMATVTVYDDGTFTVA